MVGATVMKTLAQESGENQRSRTLGLLAACGRVKKEMSEMVDGKKALEEEIQEEAGENLLVLIVAGVKPHPPMAQCKEAGGLLSPRKAAAVVLAVEEVAVWVLGGVLLLLNKTPLAGAMGANRTKAWNPLDGKSPHLPLSEGRWRLMMGHPLGVIQMPTTRLSICGIVTIPLAMVAHLIVRMAG